MIGDSKFVAGVMGGTLISTSSFPQWADLLQTVVLAAVGAAVSYLTAWLLQQIVRRKRR